MESDDGLFLPPLQPEVAGNPAVVLVHPAVAFPPVVELAGGDVEPLDEPSSADLGLLRPAPDEIHDLVRMSCGTQTPVRVPQDFFLGLRVRPSVQPGTSSLVWIFFSRWSI